MMDSMVRQMMGGQSHSLSLGCLMGTRLRIVKDRISGRSQRRESSDLIRPQINRDCSDLIK